MVICPCFEYHLQEFLSPFNAFSLLPFWKSMPIYNNELHWLGYSYSVSSRALFGAGDFVTVFKEPCPELNQSRKHLGVIYIQDKFSYNLAVCAKRGVTFVLNYPSLLLNMVSFFISFYLTRHGRPVWPINFKKWFLKRFSALGRNSFPPPIVGYFDVSLKILGQLYTDLAFQSAARCPELQVLVASSSSFVPNIILISMLLSHMSYAHA